MCQRFRIRALGCTILRLRSGLIFSRSLREVGAAATTPVVYASEPLGEISGFGLGPTFAKPGQTWGTLR
jgi:hypothetical protein